MESQVICIMPMGDGQTIHPAVMAGIASQTIPVHLLPLSRPIEHFDLGKMDKVFSDKIRTNRKSITSTRNIIKTLGTQKSNKYVLHLDSDVVFTSPTDVEDMVKFLEENPTTAVVGLNTKNINLENMLAGHVSMACLLFRKEILEKYTFHNGRYNRDCNCQMLTNDIRKMEHPDGGFWEIRYLDNRHLYEVERI